MANIDSNRIVQKLWSYCNALRDDGLSYKDCLERLTFVEPADNLLERIRQERK